MPFEFVRMNTLEEGRVDGWLDGLDNGWEEGCAEGRTEGWDDGCVGVVEGCLDG